MFQSAVPANPEKDGLRIVQTPEIDIAIPLFLIHDKKMVFSAPQTELISEIRNTFANFGRETTKS